VIVGTFGPEGPDKCRGLDVMRYDADSLHDEFGSRFRLVESSKEPHRTPFGTTQQFRTWLRMIARAWQGTTSRYTRPGRFGKTAPKALYLGGPVVQMTEPSRAALAQALPRKQVHSWPVAARSLAWQDSAADIGVFPFEGRAVFE
jgi:hypothetical protein